MTFTIKHTNIAKGAAILLLVYYHIFIGFDDFHYDLAMSAHCCVWLFVFISGFGIARSMGSKASSLKKTLIRIAGRVWKLQAFFWPHFVIGVAVLYLVLHRTLMQQYGNIWRVILDLFCLSDICNQTHIFGVWWYMGLAVLLAVIAPLLIKLAEKTGYWILPIVYVAILIIPDVIGKFAGSYQGYYLAAVAGIVCAKKQLPDKYVDHIGKASALRKVVISLIFLFVAVILGIVLSLTKDTAWTETFYIPQIIKTIQAVLVILLMVNVSTVGWMAAVFEFLGKLSDDLFIMHITARTIFSGVVYYVDNPFYIYTTLLIISIVMTLGLKLIKKYTRYDDLTKKVSAALSKKAA